MNKDYRHYCPVCRTGTTRKVLCENCLDKHELTGCYDNIIREWEANRCWTTQISTYAYHNRLRDLVRDLPVSRTRKREFMAVMKTAFRKEKEL